MSRTDFTEQIKSFLTNHHRVIKELEKGLKRPDGKTDFSYRYSMMLEEDLKVSFIEPLIHAIGYSNYLESEKFFRREWKEGKGKPVDYLLVDGNSKCILEIKSPKSCTTTNSTKEIFQLLSYMVHYEINRGCLTDGLGWIFIYLDRQEMRELRLCDSGKATISSKRLEVVFNEIASLSPTPEVSSLEVIQSFDVDHSNIPNGELKEIFLSYPGETIACTNELGPNKTYKCVRTYRMGEYYRIDVQFGEYNIRVGKRLDKKHIPNYGSNYIVTKNWFAEWSSRSASNTSEVYITGFMAMAYLLRTLSESEEIVDLSYFYPDVNKYIPREWTPLTKKGYVPLIPLAVPDDILQEDPHWQGYICLYG